MARPLPKSSPDDKTEPEPEPEPEPTPRGLPWGLGCVNSPLARNRVSGVEPLSLSLSLVHSYLSWHGWDLKLSVLCKLASPFQPRRTSDMLSVCVAWTPAEKQWNEAQIESPRGRGRGVSLKGPWLLLVWGNGNPCPCHGFHLAL